MDIIDTDGSGRLYQVNNLLTADELADVMSTHWLDLPWKRGPGQQHWPRRWLLPDQRVTQLTEYVDSKLNQINELIGKKFNGIGTHWWVDEPGFTVAMHTDGHLPYTMQLYWEVPSEEFGTVFYHYKTIDSLRYKFLSIPNHGYIMDNKCDDDYQMLQWHSMLNKVPEGTIRVSSYSWFF